MIESPVVAEARAIIAAARGPLQRVLVPIVCPVRRFEFPFPQPDPWTVAAPRIGGDQ